MNAKTSTMDDDGDPAGKLMEVMETYHNWGNTLSTTWLKTKIRIQNDVSLIHGTYSRLGLALIMLHIADMH